MPDARDQMPENLDSGFSMIKAQRSDPWQLVAGIWLLSEHPSK
jgi:hypothetical protein